MVNDRNIKVESKNPHLYRVVFVEDWRSRACKMIDLINLNQQLLCDICSGKRKVHAF